MAATYRMIGVDYETHDPSKPVAFLFDLPLMFDEAFAFSNVEAGCPTDRDREILRAWAVKMTLVHGTWVEERCRFYQI
jgi:hypothetical protein